jgi:tetratricopeptide (TPR) repeat protein
VETKDIIFGTVAGLALIVSIVSFIFPFRQRATEDRRSTRKALTDVVAELTKVNIAFNQLDLDHPQSADVTIVSLRRNYNNQRRYLANHGEFLAGQIPELTSDIDCITLAFAFESSGDYIKAQKFYELAVEKSPTSVLRIWNLRGLARFWFNQGNAQRGRKAYEESLQQQVSDTDSIKQTVADTYLLWSRLEDEYGYVGEANRARTLGQQAAGRIGNSRMREIMLKQLSGALTEAGDKRDGQSASNSRITSPPPGRP